MLTITEAAGGSLNEWLVAEKAAPDTAVRLSVAPNGFTATLDKERPGDSSVDHEGRKVLLMDEQASSVLSERTLDVKGTPGGPKLGLT